MRLGDIKIEPQPCPHCGDTVAVGDFQFHIESGDCEAVVA